MQLDCRLGNTDKHTQDYSNCPNTLSGNFTKPYQNLQLIYNLNNVWYIIFLRLIGDRILIFEREILEQEAEVQILPPRPSTNLIISIVRIYDLMCVRLLLRDVDLNFDRMNLNML